MIASLRAAAGGRAVHRRHRAGREPCANSAFPSWKPGPIRAIPSTCWSDCPTTTPASWRPAIWPSAATGAWPSWPATAAAANCAARASRAGGRRRTGRGQSAEAYPRDPIDMLVGLSNYDAGFMAASHLAERGYRRVAFHGPPRRPWRIAARAAAAAAQRAAGVVAELAVDNPATLPMAGPRWPGCVARRQVDAVFCANDLLAVAPCSKRATSWRAARDLPCWALAKPISPARSARLTTIGVDSWTSGDAAKCCCSAWAAACRPILSDAAIHARAASTPPSGGTGARPWPGYMLAGPLSHFQNGRKTHARLERPLLRAGRPERRLRARRAGRWASPSRG